MKKGDDMLKNIKYNIYLVPSFIWSILLLVFCFKAIDNIDYSAKLIFALSVGLIYSLVLNNLVQKYFLGFFIPLIPAFYVYNLNNDNIISLKKLILVIVIAIFTYFSKKFSSSTIIKILLYIAYLIFSLLLIAIFYLSYTALYNELNYSFILKIFITFQVILFNIFFLDEKNYSSKYLNILFIIFITAIFILIYSFIFSSFIQDKYSTAAIIILCAAYPLLLSYFVFNKKWILIFNILPLMFLIYYVSTNIQKYGITENRYFTLFFGITALIMTILALFNKIKSSSIFSSICILSLIIFYTPYINVFDVTKRNLVKRYYASNSIEEKANIYYYGKDRLWNLPYVEANTKETTLIQTYTKRSEKIEIKDIHKYSKVQYLSINELSLNKQNEIAKKIIDNKLENETEKIIPISYTIDKNLDNNTLSIIDLKILILTK